MRFLSSMYKAKNYLMLFGAVSILSLSSCTDDNKPTDGGSATISSSFPMTNGSYWVYQNQEIDTNGAVVPAIIGFDSTVAGAGYSLDGKTAVDFNTYSADENGVYTSEASGTTIYAKEGNIVYTSSSSMLADMIEGQGLPIAPADLAKIDKWLIAMQDKAIWEVLSLPMEIDDVPFLGDLPVKVGLKATVGITGAKIGNDQVVVAGKTYNATKFAMNIGFIGDLALSESFVVLPKGTKVATIASPMVTNIWIVDGIGIVKTRTSNSELKIEIVPAVKAFAENLGIADMAEKTPGSVSTLVRYNVK